jgi:hypothetical protein
MLAAKYPKSSALAKRSVRGFEASICEKSNGSNKENIKYQYIINNS